MARPYTMCKCDVSCLIYLMHTRFLFFLDQFYLFYNLILILKFHKIILAPLLGASSTLPKQSGSYSSNWNFYCSGLGVAFVHLPVVYLPCFNPYVYVAQFPCECCCLLLCGRVWCAVFRMDGTCREMEK
jgi:hypothetical protein